MDMGVVTQSSRVMRSSDNWCSFWIVTPIYTFACMLITVDW